MRRFAPIIILVVLFVMAVVYLPGLSKYLKLKSKEGELVAEIARLRKEVEALKAEGELLRTDATRLEEVAREELGLVKSGEIIYKVVEKEPEASESLPAHPT